MIKHSLSSLASLIKEPKKTLILCHKNPDPDTIGSALSLSMILEKFNSSVSIACADKIPERLLFLLEDVTVLNEIVTQDYERIIAVDVASPSQLGDFESFYESVDLIIDHHSMNTRFTDYYEDFCCACAQIIFDLANELKIFDDMKSHFYKSIYAGVSGDTGCFKFQNVTPKTLICASKLIEKEFDFAEINRLIFDSKTMGEISAQRATYENFKMLCDSKLAIIMISNEIKQAYNITDEDISDVVNHIRQIKGVLVAVSIKQSSKHEEKYTISARSCCDIDVSKICAKVGGGGHKRASGASITATSPDEAFEAVKNLFSDGVLNYGK